MYGEERVSDKESVRNHGSSSQIVDGFVSCCFAHRSFRDELS
jgi:hypothetical protein